MTAQKSDKSPVSGQTTAAPTSSNTPAISGGGTAALQLKASLRGHDYDTQVQMLAPEGGGGGDKGSVHQAAARGISGGGGKLPNADKIQASFGGYDISNVQAHLGGDAAEASRAMGADAYATGNHVVLGAAGQDLHTIAHEAAHVVQQREGVALSGGVGQAGDRYEKHADDVADAVVAGKSAEGILGQMAGSGGGGGSGVQLREDKDAPAPSANSAGRDKPGAHDNTHNSNEAANQDSSPALANEHQSAPGKTPTEGSDPNALEAAQLDQTLCVDLRKMGHDFLSHGLPDGTYIFQNQKDRSIELTPAQLRTRAQTVLGMHDDFDPEWLDLIIKAFPQWIMENCYILPEEGLKYMVAEEDGRLRRIINQMKYGSPPPDGNWAAFATAGKQARKTIAPAMSAFQWAMFLNSCCILLSGLAAGAAFEIARGAFQLVWAGTPDKKNGLKNLMAEALEPPKLTLVTAGPLQREIITSRYFNDDAIVHRFFNANYPQAPFPLRAKLAAGMMAIS